MEKQNDYVGGLIVSVLLTLFLVAMAVVTYQDPDAPQWLGLILMLGAVLVIIATIAVIVEESNRKAKNEQQNKAAKNIEYDSDYGNEELKLYFDSKKAKVTICVATTTETKQEEIDNFIQSNIFNINNYIVVVDFVNLKILKVGSKDGKINKKLYELEDKLKSLDINLKNSEPALKTYNNYAFITDDINEYVVIVTPIGINIHRYSDIISVSYQENGTDVYNKSLGGAVVGGLLFGGIGAIVGGSTAKTKQNKEVNNMSIKILLKCTSNPTLILNIYDGAVLKTKNKSDQERYEKLMKEVSGIKDIFSIIIDIVDRRNVSTSSTVISSQTSVSVADELEKLVKLKDSGILTEEEFNDQKTKILNKG